MTTAQDFAAAVAAEFGGGPWRVEPRDNGFAAIVDLAKKPPISQETLRSGISDEFVIDVTVDGSTFSWDAGRAASRDRDRTRTRPGHYSRQVDSYRYTGSRQSWSFKRTPGGLVPDDTDPFNTSARLQQLVAIGERIGLTVDPAQRPAAPATPSKRTLVLVVVAFGVVLAIIGTVATLVVSAVFSRM